MGLKIDDEGIHFTSDGIDSRRDKLYKQIGSTITTISLMVALIVYLILGFTVDGGWADWWPILFAGLVPGETVECILRKKANVFPIWAVCLLAYFVCAQTAHLGYHPYWVILLLIPIYYGAVNSITQLVRRKKELDVAEKDAETKRADSAKKVKVEFDATSQDDGDKVRAEFDATSQDDSEKK